MIFSKSLVAASSKPLILGILQEGSSYGYKIMQRAKEISTGKIDWAEGMLYPVLHRLEKDKLVISEWVQSEEGRHRRVYSITNLGKASLHQEKESWIKMNAVMVNLWSLTPSN